MEHGGVSGEECAEELQEPLKITKKYCDNQFKNKLAKQLKVNLGEPENIDRIRSNKLLIHYDPEKIINFTNNAAKEVEKNVEKSITTPRIKEIIEFTKSVRSLVGKEKTEEIPLLAKLNSTSRVPFATESNLVNFDALNKYLYTAVSGKLDAIDMNYETRVVLQDTFYMLMEKVEKDAPKVLQELREKMATQSEDAEHEQHSPLEEELKDTLINPFHIPQEFLFQKKSSE